MRRFRNIGDGGMALVTALVILLALTILGISAVTVSTLDIQMAGNERFAAQALHLADSGIEMAIVDLMSEFKNSGTWNGTSMTIISNGVDYTRSLTHFTNLSNSVWGDPFSGAGGLDGSSGDTDDLYGGVQTVSGPGGGLYRVLLARSSADLDRGKVKVRSYSLHPTGARKVIELYLVIENIDAWNNAIFAGAGSATATIEGNITVAGSVHVLGTGQVNNWTISGSAEIVNGYKGMSADVLSRLDMSAIPTVGTFNGQPVYSLEAVMRVKNVNATVAGSGNISPTWNDSDIKGTLADGTRVVEWGGVYYKADLDGINSKLNIEVTGGGNCRDSTNYKVCARVGNAATVNMPDGYDLGDKVAMPSMDDDYAGQKDLLGQTCAQAGITCEDYEDYIRQMSVDIQPEDLGGVCKLVPGDTPSFCRGYETSTFPCGSCIDANGCFMWNTTTASIHIEGRVQMPPCDSEIGKANYPIKYTGKGILYSTNNTTIKSEFLTDTADGKKFVEDHLLGLTVGGELKLDMGANTSFMGALFATDIINSVNNSQVVVGAMVSNKFNLPSGAGNTAIYHVKGLSEAVQGMGMPKSTTTYNFSTFNWTEIEH